MDQDFYIQLIHQSLRGELSAEGAEQLAAWRAASPENATLEAQARKGWELSGQYDPEIDIDVSDAFNKLRTRVRAHETKEVTAKTATVRPLRRWLSIAASVLVLLTAAWVFWPGAEASPPMLVIELGPEDSVRTVRLPDGSTTWLQPNSRLSYPESFAASERPVELKGEAYFKVKTNPAATFRVTTDALTVEVLGTEFLLSAYPNEDIEVSLDEGKVAVSTPQESMDLAPGESARYQRENKTLRPTEFKPNAAAWKNNTLVFFDQPLQQVLNDLEEYAGVAVALNNPALEDCLFSGKASGDSPAITTQKLLNILADTFGLDWTADGTNYQLQGGSCN